MSDNHDDNKCGVCGGPLESHRCAVCETCVPESQYFEDCAAMQEACEMSDQVPEGCVWLCRDYYIDTIPKIDSVFISRIKPTRHWNDEDERWSWVVREVTEMDKATALHLVGDIPLENEARMVDVRCKEYLCVPCGKTKWRGHYVCPTCENVIQRQRARVLETIKLEVCDE